MQRVSSDTAMRPRATYMKDEEPMCSKSFSCEIRYDYFLIWGNGLAYRDEILDYIISHGDFEIIKIVQHSPKSIKKLVKEIYSYDYAPYWHLRGKTKYLLTTIPQVIFIFVRNMNPTEDYSGEGSFRHIESGTVKLLKEQIRNRFNERKEDRRTENHVVHASDNECQVDHILRYLGFKEGLNYLKQSPNKILDAPYYIPEFKLFTLRNIDIESLFCNILRGTRGSHQAELIPLEESPHYVCLQGRPEVYQRYLQEFLGGPLDQYYSVKKFLNLSKDLKYPGGSSSSKFILVHEFEKDKYAILDGVHRASVLKFRNEKKIMAAIIEA